MAQIAIPEPMGRGRPSKERKARWNRELFEFCEGLKAIQQRLPEKMMRRSWCYYLEGMNAISKGEFEYVEDLITRSRKRTDDREACLPADFLQDDKACDFTLSGVAEESQDPKKYFSRSVKSILDMEERYHVSDSSFWLDQDYFIQMLVEKVDLKSSVYGSVCMDYQIPIANARGWPNVTTRGILMDQFTRAYEEREQTPILLVAGDHDPHGFRMTEEQQVKKLLSDIRHEEWMDYLEVRRVGINTDFIEEHDIEWIDNLESGSGNKLEKEDKEWIERYINEHGRRKVEANMLVIPEYKYPAQSELREIIESYIPDARGDYREKIREKEKAVRELKEEHIDIKALEELLEELDLGEE